MTPNDSQDDPVFATLRDLPGYDVSPARAHRLRARCYDGFTTQNASRHVPRRRKIGWLHVMRVFAGGWSILYLFETLRRAAAVYGF
jgi:hypothetical protein